MRSTGTATHVELRSAMKLLARKPSTPPARCSSAIWSGRGSPRERLMSPSPPMVSRNQPSPVRGAPSTSLGCRRTRHAL